MVTNKRLNNLDGKRWLQHSFSIWRDIEKNPEERKLKHPAMFPIMLAERIIDIFTNSSNQVVLDPFMGSGTTLIASKNKNLKSVGFEISKSYISMSEKRLDDEYSTFQNRAVKYKIINDSAENISKHIDPETIDLTITSPPYWDILNRNRTADRKDIRNYGNLSNDFGNVHDYAQFLNMLQNVFKQVYAVTRQGRFCIVVVMDIRKKDKFFPFHSDLVEKMVEVGFKFEDIIIWDRQKEYNNMRPLGYPTVFRINKVHEYILIFKK